MSFASDRHVCTIHLLVWFFEIVDIFRARWKHVHAVRIFCVAPGSPGKMSASVSFGCHVRNKLDRTECSDLSLFTGGSSACGAQYGLFSLKVGHDGKR